MADVHPIHMAKHIVKRLLTSPEKIVCVGLGKTGTTSFAEAMRHLGYRHKTLGLRHAYDNRRPLPIRLALMRHQSFDDFPWNYLYEKVDVLYPRSRFVLTTRVSATVWFDSLLRHTEREGETENHLSFYGYRHPSQNKRHFLNLYETHNARVREYFRGCPRFTELCWEKGDGWAELCGFLDKPVPDLPFPHANRGVQP